jgi:outer membrane protein insertion porin family
LRHLILAGALLLGLGGRVTAQDAPAGPPPVDSIAVEGAVRVPGVQIITLGGIQLGQQINYRDIQRALQNLFQTGQFDDVRVEQRGTFDRLVLVYVVRERPLLSGWSVRGAEKLFESEVRGKVRVTEGKPIDRVAVARSVAAIDSLYKQRGFYSARISVDSVIEEGNRQRLVFAVSEGNRVSIAQVRVEGNVRFKDEQIVGAMSTKPEGFWWFRKGDYDETRLQDDMRARIPAWYAERGYLDFQVVRDSLLPDTASGKATLVLQVEEGPQFTVGTFDITGNRRFSSDELAVYYPFGTEDARTVAKPGTPFNRTSWDGATEKLRSLYSDNGYIYAQVQPEEIRRTGPDGQPVVDLRWSIREGAPATVNKISIVGNDVTHERVIRDAIVLLPGQVFSRALLIRSIQNISNLNFFQQNAIVPDVQTSANGVDVDVTFRVEERRTGNINFGASLGQGTGVGGFLGLEEPNLFGKAKRGRLQWQFGANINDFNLSYTDPAIRETRVSGTLSLFDSRARFILADLGRRRTRGGSLQLGFPFFGSRYTRYFLQYRLQQTRFDEGSQDLSLGLRCANCTQSSLGLSLLRDTRIGLPFATAGQYLSANVEQTGGVLGGTGNYQKMELEGRWYAPIGQLGGNGFGSGIQFTVGFTAKSGFVFGNADNFPLEQFSMGGVQFGIPLRGYNEFSITPNGFDVRAGGQNAAGISSFGRAYSAFTVEAGARLSQMFYVSSFFDAGNVYRTARQYDPTRLLRGAGIGLALISPLGPIGVDLARGFDRTDNLGRPRPGWQVHFRLGNFF